MWVGMDAGPLHRTHHSELVATHLLPQEAEWPGGPRSPLLTLWRKCRQFGLGTVSLVCWRRHQPSNVGSWLFSHLPPCPYLGCSLKDSLPAGPYQGPDSFLGTLPTGIIVLPVLCGRGPWHLWRERSQEHWVPLGGLLGRCEPFRMPIFGIIF